jgi:hypothetical protein
MPPDALSTLSLGFSVFEMCLRIGSRRMRFPVAATKTFEAPVQTAAALPWRLFLATDRRSSAW